MTAPVATALGRGLTLGSQMGGLAFVPLKRLTTANDGGVWGADSLDGTGTIVLRSTDQTVDGKWVLTDPAVRRLTPRELLSARLHEGDLLITKSSGSANHIGKTTLVTRDIAEMQPCYSNFMQRVRLKSDVDPRIVWYWLNSADGRQRLAQASNTTTGLANLNGEILGRVTVPILPYDEQLRIAAFLDHETARIDELVQEQETLQRHVKRRRMAAIDATLWGESPLPEWDLGSSSTSRTVQREGWRRLRLKHVVDHLTVGVVVEPTQYVAADGLPYIYGADIKDGAIHWEHARRIDPEVSRTLKKSLLRTGDVLVVRVGDPGQCAVVPPECEGGNCASVVHIRTSPGVLPEWLALAIRAARTQAQIDLVVYGAAQRQFNVAHALEFWLDVPPLAVQQRAVEAVRVADEGMRVLDEAVALSTLLLRERRSALITAAVTGQIDVRSWTPPDDWLSTETT